MRQVIPIDWSKRHSDHQEDFILRLLFPYAKGTYVEIGVFDADAFSNTKVFYDLGWNGLLIEPVAQWGRKVLAQRPRDVLVQKAVSNYNGTVDLFVNSARTSISKEWAGLTSEAKPVNVPVIRMDSLMPLYPQFMTPDFCSLDVEGHEKPVLEGIDWSIFKPAVYCIEAIAYEPALKRVHRNWENILIDNGYKLICHNLQNRFYGRIDNADIWEKVEQCSLGE